MRLVDSWAIEEDKDIEADVDQDVGHLEGAELLGLLLVAQVTERNAGECIDGYDDGHDGDVFGMGTVPERLRDGSKERQHQG